MTLTIVYDNYGYVPGMRTAWGFACWIETGDTTVLFDTGGDSPTLLHNLSKLALDPQSVDIVVLSHIHGDHVGGLMGLLDAGARPTAYAPAAFPASFKADIRERVDLVEVTEPAAILPGIWTTGQMGTGVVEQGLVVETDEGLIVVTGCAHPGIVAMVERAKEVASGEVALVVGGFHLGGASRAAIADIITDLRRLGVQRVAPCHCTGDLARRVFADAYDAECALGGVGWRFETTASR